MGIISEETKKKISETLKRKYKEGKLPTAFKPGHKVSEEVRRKIGEKNSKKIWTDEEKENISVGLRKAYKNGILGTSEHRENISKSLKGRIFTEEWIENLSKAHIGQISTKKGKTFDEFYGLEKSEEIKDKLRKARMNQKIFTKNTSIEIALQNELTARGITYQTHIPIENICIPDIVLLNRRIIIFADGDYWHSLPNRIEKDNIINKKLAEKRWKVFRFSESDIKESVQWCVDQIPIWG